MVTVVPDVTEPAAGENVGETADGGHVAVVGPVKQPVHSARLSGPALVQAGKTLAELAPVQILLPPSVNVPELIT